MDHLDFSNRYRKVYSTDTMMSGKKIYIDRYLYIDGKRYDLPSNAKPISIQCSATSLYILMDDGMVYRVDNLLEPYFIECGHLPTNVLNIIKIRKSDRIAFVLEDGSLLEESGGLIYKFDDVVLVFSCRYVPSYLFSYEPIYSGAYAVLVDWTRYEFDASTYKMLLHQR